MGARGEFYRSIEKLRTTSGASVKCQTCRQKVMGLVVQSASPTPATFVPGGHPLWIPVDASIGIFWWPSLVTVRSKSKRCKANGIAPQALVQAPNASQTMDRRRKPTGASHSHHFHTSRMPIVAAPGRLKWCFRVATIGAIEWQQQALDATSTSLEILARPLFPFLWLCPSPWAGAFVSVGVCLHHSASTWDCPQLACTEDARLLAATPLHYIPPTPTHTSPHARVHVPAQKLRTWMENLTTIRLVTDPNPEAVCKLVDRLLRMDAQDPAAVNSWVNNPFLS